MEGHRVVTWGQTFGSIFCQMKKTGFISAFLLFMYSVYGHTTDPVGPRSAALGTSSVALKDPWCALNNQAGLASLHRITCAVNYENRFLLKELSSRSATLAIPLHTGTIGFSMTSFGYSLYHENRYNLAFGKALSDYLSMGIGLNYFHTRIAEGGARRGAFAGEIGMLAKVQKQMLLGVHLFNPVRSQSQEGLPVAIKIGINYSYSSSVSFTLETAKELSRKAVFKAGIEYLPCSSVFLRAGISSDPARSAFGMGFLLHPFQLDLSASYLPSLGISTQLNVIYFFGQHDKPVRSDH